MNLMFKNIGMKNFTYIVIIIFGIFSCKSTKEVKNNKLDIVSVKSNNIQTDFNISNVQLNESDIIIIPSNPEKETILTDSNGNTKKFQNVKKIQIKTKNEIKKDSTSSEKSIINEKIIDNSVINEKTESVSDTVQYKGIFMWIAIIVFCLLIIYLVFKFKK